MLVFLHGCILLDLHIPLNLLFIYLIPFNFHQPSWLCGQIHGNTPKKDRRKEKINEKRKPKQNQNQNRNRKQKHLLKNPPSAAGCTQSGGGAPRVLQ
jgi:hypothetical protein